MIKRVLVVSMVGLSLVGCVNNDTLSGDVYTASEAKQVQNVSYGTIVNVRPVQIQGGDDSNVIGAIGGAVLGGFLGNTVCPSQFATRRTLFHVLVGCGLLMLKVSRLKLPVIWLL